MLYLTLFIFSTTYVIKELLLIGLGYKQSRPHLMVTYIDISCDAPCALNVSSVRHYMGVLLFLLQARVNEDLLIYEVYNFTGEETSSSSDAHLQVRFRKLHHGLILKEKKVQRGLMTSPHMYLNDVSILKVCVVCSVSQQEGGDGLGGARTTVRQGQVVATFQRCVAVFGRTFENHNSQNIIPPTLKLKMHFQSVWTGVRVRTLPSLVVHDGQGCAARSSNGNRRIRHVFRSVPQHQLSERLPLLQPTRLCIVP